MGGGGEGDGKDLHVAPDWPASHSDLAHWVWDEVNRDL